MQDQGSGSIIMVGSVSGALAVPRHGRLRRRQGRPDHLVTSLAIEWGPAVRINCVAPGFVATESVTEQYGDPDTVAAVAATVPLGLWRPRTTWPRPACSSRPRAPPTSAVPV